MTRKDFYFEALLRISSNSAFGNGHGSYINYPAWAERIGEAAASLILEAEKKYDFDKKQDEPP